MFATGRCQPDLFVRIDLIRLWLTVALAGVLAIATVAVYQPQTNGSVADAPDQGQRLFLAKGCSGCHTLEGVAETASVGPNLSSLRELAGERIPGVSGPDYVRQSLREPQAFIAPGFEASFVNMPTLKLSDSEVQSLIELLLIER